MIREHGAVWRARVSLLGSALSLATLLFATMIVLAPPPVSAAACAPGADPVRVSVATDSVTAPAVGSLRWAIDTVCDGGSIFFDLPRFANIFLAGEIHINKSVLINGQNFGAEVAGFEIVPIINPFNHGGFNSINPEWYFRLFTVGSTGFTGEVTLVNMRLANGIAKGFGGSGGGGAGMGGGILHLGGTLNISSTSFTGNNAVGASIDCCFGGGGGGFGGPSNVSAGGSGGFLGGVGGAAGADDATLIGNGNAGSGADGQGGYNSLLGAGGGAGGNSGWGTFDGDTTAGNGGNGGFGAGGGRGGRGGRGGATVISSGFGTFTWIGSHGGRGGIGGVGGFGGGGGAGGAGGGSGTTGVQPALVNLGGALGGAGGAGTFGGGNATNGTAGGAGRWRLVPPGAANCGPQPANYYACSGANGTQGMPGAGAGFGGAVFSLSGTLNLSNVDFQRNRAIAGGDTATRTDFRTSCVSAPADSCGDGRGGALFIYKGVTATANGVTFDGNEAASAGTDTLSRRDYDGIGRLPGEGQRQCPGVDTVDVCGVLTVIPTPDVTIDGPTPGSFVGDSVNISGWALSNKAGIGSPVTLIVVYVNDVFAGTGTYGLARPDVCAVYPGRPDCPNVGFSYALDTSGLAPGSHVVRVEAWNAGPAGTAEVTVRVDGTPPFGVPDIAGTLGTDGWYVSPVAVTWSLGDPESGIASSTGCDDRTYTDDTPPVFGITGVALRCVVTNGSGLTGGYGTLFPDFKIDTTPPVVTAAATLPDASPYIAGTWTDQAVTVTFTCSDSVSGLGSCPPPTVVTANGVTASVGGTGTDSAGNSATAGFGPIWIDTVAPTITASATTADAAPYIADTPINQAVTVTFECGDAGSGVASCPPDQTVSADGVTASVDGTAVDNVGNSAMSSFGPIRIDSGLPTPLMPQAITFAPIADRDLLATLDVAASASSGLPVGFTAVGVCSVTGATLTMSAAGTCTVTATQPGDATFEAALAVDRSFELLPLPVTFVVAGPPTATRVGTAATFVATLPDRAGLPRPTGIVRFVADTGATADVAVSAGVATWALADLPLGVNVISAAYLGDSNFAPGLGSTSANHEVITAPSSLTGLPPVVKPGESVGIDAAGFDAGEQVTFVFNSNPVTVGVDTSTQFGGATLTFLVPNVGPGAHTLTATGATSGIVASASTLLEATVVVPNPVVPNPVVSVPESTAPSTTTPVSTAPTPTVPVTTAFPTVVLGDPGPDLAPAAPPPAVATTTTPTVPLGATVLPQTGGSTGSTSAWALAILVVGCAAAAVSRRRTGVRYKPGP